MLGALEYGCNRWSCVAVKSLGLQELAIVLNPPIHESWELEVTDGFAVLVSETEEQWLSA